jgi:hypothetical protein
MRSVTASRTRVTSLRASEVLMACNYEQTSRQQRFACVIVTRVAPAHWLASIALALVIALAGAARADDIAMPPGTRKDADDQLVSSRGLRDTTDFVAKQLARKGIAVDQIGPYKVRGVDVTRFVSQTASTSWLAIHVMRSAGKTLIFFVPR